jgi:hypothetical protein
VSQLGLASKNTDQLKGVGYQRERQSALQATRRSRHSFPVKYQAMHLIPPYSSRLQTSAKFLGHASDWVV